MRLSIASFKLLQLPQTVLIFLLSTASYAHEIVRVNGDMPCPGGTSLVTVQEAEQNKKSICDSLDRWSIVRLEAGGSMDGPGYGCKIRDTDGRSLGQSLCKQPQNFKESDEDGKCTDEGYTLVNSYVARGYSEQMCLLLKEWDIARLAGGGSMSGHGYGCEIRESDPRPLGNSLCGLYEFHVVSGDVPCAGGNPLLPPVLARKISKDVCKKLNQWDIARLAGGGSMSGPGYGCEIRDLDDRTLGNALCLILPN